MKAVYLGMAMDVMAPLLLESGLDELFAIDLVEDGYAGVANGWDGQKNEIKRALDEGNDANLAVARCHHNDYVARKPHHQWGRATLLPESEDNLAWRLAFMWGGRKRRLCYWHHRDFRKPWPDEMVGLGAVFCMGADLHAGSEKKFKEEVDDPVVVSMLRDRTASAWRLWSLCHGQKGWHKEVVKRGGERKGTVVAWVEGGRFLQACEDSSREDMV